MSSSNSNSIAVEALNDFFTKLYSGFEEIFRRFFGNLYKSFAELTLSRWTKVILSVVGYLLIRPYIEAWFKKMSDRDRKKQLEKERAQKEAAAGEKKAKLSANALRGGSGSGEGKVLGEVDNTDDELGEVDEFAVASGVPEWGKNTRKRMKKHRKNLDKEAAENGDKLSEDQIMELLDWSESEGENKA